jgi:hypothetical protein
MLKICIVVIVAILQLMPCVSAVKYDAALSNTINSHLYGKKFAEVCNKQCDGKEASYILITQDNWPVKYSEKKLERVITVLNNKIKDILEHAQDTQEENINSLLHTAFIHLACFYISIDEMNSSFTFWKESEETNQEILNTLKSFLILFLWGFKNPERSPDRTFSHFHPDDRAVVKDIINNQEKKEKFTAHLDQCCSDILYCTNFSNYIKQPPLMHQEQSQNFKLIINGLWSQCHNSPIFKTECNLLTKEWKDYPLKAQSDLINKEKARQKTLNTTFRERNMKPKQNPTRAKTLLLKYIQKCIYFFLLLFR